jgi:predicted phage gp36 major capsid-like protein
MPNEGANNFPIAVGDFYKAYRVIDRVQMQVLRDPYTLSQRPDSLSRSQARGWRGCSAGSHRQVEVQHLSHFLKRR